MARTPAAGAPPGLAIDVAAVSKRFRLGSGSVKRAIIDRRSGHTRDFWALTDVTFAVPAGSSVAVIGANGSGKSTLLKLLAGVLVPTSGAVRTSGRVSALIELGAGFHPDLSGRDNVFLAAALLGLRRSEVRTRFDEIVDFAGLERFIDTPVKRYSSGMYVRLGFAIAVHVDPEVLLVDEVLAVGDAAFQRKCLMRLREYRAGGGTLLLVTHGLGLAVEFCDRALWIDAGRLAFDGPPSDAVSSYLAAVAERQDGGVDALAGARSGPQPHPGMVAGPGDTAPRSGALVDRLAITDWLGHPHALFEPGDAIKVRLDYVSEGAVVLAVDIARADGLRLFATRWAPEDPPEPRRSRRRVNVEVPYLALGPGVYRVRAVAVEGIGAAGDVDGEAVSGDPGAGADGVTAFFEVSGPSSSSGSGLVHLATAWVPA